MHRWIRMNSKINKKEPHCSKKLKNWIIRLARQCLRPRSKDNLLSNKIAQKIIRDLFQSKFNRRSWAAQLGQMIWQARTISIFQTCSWQRRWETAPSMTEQILPATLTQCRIFARLNQPTCLKFWKRERKKRRKEDTQHLMQLIRRLERI